MHRLILRPPVALLPPSLNTPGWHLAAVLLVTAAVTLLASRPARRPDLRQLACGVGILAGIIFLVGLAWPAGPAERLPALMFAGLACARLMAVPRLRGWPVLAVFAVAAGWWLAEAPLSLAALGHAMPRLAIAAGWVFGLGFLLAPADGWALLAAATALFAALHAAGEPWLWPLLAAVPAGACALAPVRAPDAAVAPAPATRRKRGSAAGARPRHGKRVPAQAAEPPALVPPNPFLPAALALAVIAAAAPVPPGHLAGPADAASLAPAGAIWLMARLRRRLRWAAPAGDPLAALLAAAVVAVVAFSAAAMAGLR